MMKKNKTLKGLDFRCMFLPLWYTILLGIAFGSFAILILICIKLYSPPKYSILTRTISGLGSPEHKSHKIFNPTVLVIGIILTPFPYFLLQVLPPSWMTTLGIILFFGVPLGLILVGIFPEDKETGHMIGAIMSIGGAFIANLLLFYPILQSSLHFVINLFQIIILIFCIPLAYSAVKHMPSYEPDKPIKKISYNTNLWEWSVFLSLQAWILALYINLIAL